jgi:DNA-binding response OmpR family regulator
MVKVLVIDDEPGYRRGLEYLLAQAGYDVRTVAGGDEAIALGQAFQPEVLIVDWLLRSKRTGLDVALELTRTNPDLKTILMSGCASDDLRFVTARASVFRIIEKPFEPRELMAAVREAAGLGTSEDTPKPTDPPTAGGTRRPSPSAKSTLDFRVAELVRVRTYADVGVPARSLTTSATLVARRPAGHRGLHFVLDTHPQSLI